MKNLLVLFGFLAASFYFVAANNKLSCKPMRLDSPNEAHNQWVDMIDSCMNKTLAQIKMEFTAAMSYLALGTHFAQDKVNRPGFAEFFFKSASEERQHGIKLIEYLLMRGKLTDGNTGLPEYNVNNFLPSISTTSSLSGLDALKNALTLEISVTKSIKSMMVVCEDPQKNGLDNDYHFVDYLTTEYLEEQYKGQRDLAGKISTLQKMMAKHGELAEFLFDKKMLNGEV